MACFPFFTIEGNTVVSIFVCTCFTHVSLYQCNFLEMRLLHQILCIIYIFWYLLSNCPFETFYQFAFTSVAFPQTFCTMSFYYFFTYLPFWLKEVIKRHSIRNGLFGWNSYLQLVNMSDSREKHRDKLFTELTKHLNYK